MNRRRANSKINLRRMVLFSCFGTLMFASKIFMEFLPNVHPIAMFIVLFTVVYRVQALIPIYVFVFITGIYAGFALWWIPYLYIWTVLWAMAMFIPKKIKPQNLIIVCPIICGLHGIAYGALYAPAQAIMFGYDFQKLLVWIAMGFFPWDVIHAIGNVAMGLLVYPLSKVLRRLDKSLMSGIKQ